MKRPVVILVNAILVLVIIGLVAATWLPVIYTAVHGSPESQTTDPK